MIILPTLSEPSDSDWVWRSLVACLNGVQEAGSSNLLTQTFRKPPEVLFRGLSCFLQIKVPEKLCFPGG